MIDVLMQLLLFSAKAIILVLLFLVLLMGIVAILNRGKDKTRGKIIIKNINHKYHEIKEYLSHEILSKKRFKQFIKDQKTLEKAKCKKQESDELKNIFVLHFQGDIKASAVASLREEITAILQVATTKDEVVLRLESAGGAVHGYGLAAAQLSRLREKRIPLTVIIDKVAASGGYMMACIANKILAAPFAIIGSIGVIVQLPNFHRWLQDKQIDFEQLTAGNFKRTLTLFGQNTEDGREKLRQEIEEVHTLFKNLIQEHRQNVDLNKVATGEHWLGTQALELNLVDDLKTSDDYLLEKSNDANVYEICYQTKKSFPEKLSGAVHLLKNEFLGSVL